MNVLELDIGNTRIKWRLLAESEHSSAANGIARDVINEGVANTVQQLLASDFAQLAPDYIRLASVRADSSSEELQQWFASHWQLDARIATVSGECGGVINAYEDVTRMGVDRWLAMLAAHHSFTSPCLVVSAGTALTIDLLNARGQHLGGYILPGLAMMASAIQMDTGIRLQHEAANPSTRPGVVTEEAVYNGSLASCVALIEKSMTQMAEDNARPTIVLAGGDGPVIKSALEQDGTDNIVIAPNLVLDGLAIALPSPGEAAPR